MINLSDINDNRYSRFDIIPWWDQKILSKVKVLVIGCGALGNEIVKNLTMTGVGHIYTVDMDNVELSNLTRSVLFRKEDINKPKSETVCKRAKEINDEVELKYFTGNVFELGLGIFKEMDIVICGLDNREARLFVNQSCRKVNTPWIDGAIEVLSGVARGFFSPDKACYECTFNEADYISLNRRKSCLLLGIDDIQQGKIPTTPTISSVIAGIQVQEAIKFLHNRTELLLLNGKGFVFNGSCNDSYIVEYQFKEDCPSHYTFENILKLNIEFGKVTLQNLFEFGKKHFKNSEFIIEFNNEIIYELQSPEDKKEDYSGNMNLISAKDLKRNDVMFTPSTFHLLSPDSDLFKKYKSKTLNDLIIPFNDILILRDKNSQKEIQVEFISENIFKEP
jgi:molybdopterin/thiamine biosynthesis adenylyltransferase